MKGRGIHTGPPLVRGKGHPRGVRLAHENGLAMKQGFTNGLTRV